MSDEASSLVGHSESAVLVQIAARKGLVERVPNGQEPVIELHLEPREYVVKLDVSDNRYSNGDRKTFDAWWTAWIATPLASGHECQPGGER